MGGNCSDWLAKFLCTKEKKEIFVREKAEREGEGREQRAERERAEREREEREQVSEKTRKVKGTGGGLIHEDLLQRGLAKAVVLYKSLLS